MVFDKGQWKLRFFNVPRCGKDAVGVKLGEQTLSRFEDRIRVIQLRTGFPEGQLEKDADLTCRKGFYREPEKGLRGGGKPLHSPGP